MYKPRGTEVEMASCFAHSTVEATGSCATCSKPICAQCTEGTLAGLMCPECGAKAQARRRLMTHVKIGAVAAILVGGGVLGLVVVTRGNAATTPGGEKKAPTEQDPYIELLRKERDKAPCDADATFKLVQELNQMKRHPEAIADAELYWSKCGEFDRLKWSVIYAQHQLGKNEDALVHETDLITKDPYDSDFWWWRGEDRVKTGQAMLGLADYRQSFANSEHRNASRFAAGRIVDAAKAAGRPCEAVAAVDYFVAVHEGDRSGGFEQEVRGLDIASECAKKRGTGTTDLPRNDKVKVAIGGLEGTFLVDETCGTTTLSADFAKRAGVTPVQGPNIETIAAGAIRSGRLATTTMTIGGGAVAPDTEVAIVDALPDGLDGVLGISAMWKFELVRREETDHGLTLEGSDPSP
jgi:hypothetical protein